jgi:formylglycine-generating enzyme
MKRLVLIASIVVLITSCDRSGRGHLTGVQNRPDGFYADPPGMVYIPMGSFNMGPSDQDIAYSQNAITKTVSLPAFYMDETEITNNQYRQFVYWVRDSLAHLLLAEINEEHLILMDEYGMDIDPPLINWRARIRWDGEEERAALEELFLPEHERFFRRREIDSRKLIYRYHIIDINRAARRSERNTPRNEFVVEYETSVYPDTLAWIHDFSYAYNEPMTQQYFWHPTYDHYPVVGVNWSQARAFTIWRTNYLNSFLASQRRPFAQEFRLPTEAEWEYAARGGLDLNPYPWGGPYTRNMDGCFLANFKPLRGNYVDDGGFQTVIVGHYPPNDYGLYDMSGNVAEWTINAWDESFYNFGHDMNMHYHYEAKPEDPITLKRKAIRGGSWKDVGFQLQVGTRSYEYQDTAKSYIGFRCVQTYPGRDRRDGSGASNVY